MTRDGDNGDEAVAPTLHDPLTMRDGEARRDVETISGIGPASTALVTRPSSPADSLSGLRRYTLGKVIGRGGMGEVVSARDEQIGRVVAIKRLHGAPTPEKLTRFLREARVQGRLEHPAVVPVHELSWDDTNMPFFVMKQLTGVTLAEVLPKLVARDPEVTAKFSRQQLLRAFVDICLAIEFAHQAGVIHRDLKPANIMLGDFGEVYVLDWGIARLADEETRAPSFADVETTPDTETLADAILGTPGYIAPEQIRNDADLDGRADIYTLGCLLFEMLTLQPLHPRGRAGLTAALTGVDRRSDRVTARDADIPPELEAIYTRATATDRRDRFATARELAAAVEQFLDGNRDLTLRQDLARTEIAAARAALSDGDELPRRRDAIRAAARALALDPTNHQASELVGKLMLQPPSETPPEIDAEVSQFDNIVFVDSARFAKLAAAVYIMFFPLLYWIGFRDTWYHVVGPALSVLIIIVAQPRIVRSHPFLVGYVTLGANMLVFALFSWLVSPIIFGPGPAIITVMVLAAARIWVGLSRIAVVTCIAISLPWILQLTGLSATRISVTGSDIVMHTMAGNLGSNATIVVLIVYMLSLVALAAVLGRMQEDDRRATRRSLQLQAWHLRQLVPQPRTVPPV